MSSITKAQARGYSIYTGKRRAESDIQISSGVFASRGSSSDGDVAVYFSGTLINASSLAESVGLPPEVDPERLIAQLYSVHGREVASRLYGAYAVTIVAPDETLLFRDPFNLEDLYYAETGGCCAIATTIRAISEYVPLALNQDALPEFFVFSNLNRRGTFFAEILEPRLDEVVRHDTRTGNWSTYTCDPTAYAELVDEGLSDAQIIDRLEQLMSEGIRELRNSFPDSTLVNTLSGGVDSSLLQHYMHENGFRDSYCANVPGCGSDGAYSQGIADHMDANHRIIDIELSGFLANLERGIERVEKPMVYEGETLFVEMYERIAQHYGGRHVVCLNGGGSDAAFGHGKSLNVVNYLRRAPGLFGLLNSVLGMASKGKSAIIRECLRAIQDDTVHPEFLIAVTNRNAVADLVGKALHRPATDAATLRCQDANSYGGGSMIERMYRTHIFRSDCLRNANSEYKFAQDHNMLLVLPFLERKLVSFLLNIPIERKIRRATKKYYAKKLLERHVPKQLIYRKKQTKGVPFGEMFREDEGFRTMIEELKDAKYGYFDFDYDEVFSRPGFETLGLKLIDFHIWHRKFLS